MILLSAKDFAGNLICEVEVSTLPCIVGRATTCDVVLNDSSVSAKHLRISMDAKEVLFEDLKSSNGSYFEGRKQSSYKSASKKFQMQLGKVRVEVEIVAETTIFSSQELLVNIPLPPKPAPPRKKGIRGLPLSPTLLWCVTAPIWIAALVVTESISGQDLLTSSLTMLILASGSAAVFCGVDRFFSKTASFKMSCAFFGFLGCLIYFCEELTNFLKFNFGAQSAWASLSFGTHIFLAFVGSIACIYFILRKTKRKTLVLNFGVLALVIGSCCVIDWSEEENSGTLNYSASGETIEKITSRKDLNPAEHSTAKFIAGLKSDFDAINDDHRQ